jgi:GTP-binding protein
MASGKTGVSAIIRLPLGTSIYNSDTGELIADILEDGQVHVICYGGKGGHGNAFFKSSFNRIPSLHENGDIGESMNIELKLKYVADVGLVGLPNAGKSTLISQISNAKPRIANYQFTTLTPVLGTVNIGKDNLVFEDIPGLINGASEGKGLGHEFLKHIERCYVLIHLISLDPQDNADAYEAYETITNELKQYSAAVGNKPVFIVANKIDTEGSDENLKLLEKKLGKKVLAISGKEKTNVDKLLQTVYKEYSKIIEEIKKYESENKKEPIPEQKEKKFFKDVRIIPMEEGI